MCMIIGECVCTYFKIDCCCRIKIAWNKYFQTHPSTQAVQVPGTSSLLKCHRPIRLPSSMTWCKQPTKPFCLECSASDFLSEFTPPIQTRSSAVVSNWPHPLAELFVIGDAFASDEPIGKTIGLTDNLPMLKILKLKRKR